MKLKNPKKEPLTEEEIVETNGISGSFVDNEPDVFYFTNGSNEDWSTQWNKIIYTFPAQKTVKMSIRDATPLEVQSIRKMFAFRFAQDQFLKSDTYKNLVAVGKAQATTYNEKLLQPWIDECLKPLEKARLGTQEIHDNPDAAFTASKAVDGAADLNQEFYEANKELLRR